MQERIIQTTELTRRYGGFTAVDRSTGAGWQA